jgi:hypothetical protein
LYPVRQRQTNGERRVHTNTTEERERDVTTFRKSTRTTKYIDIKSQRERKTRERASKPTREEEEEEDNTPTTEDKGLVVHTVSPLREPAGVE